MSKYISEGFLKFCKLISNLILGQIQLSIDHHIDVQLVFSWALKQDATERTLRRRGCGTNSL